MQLPANELSAGDYIKTPDGIASLHRVPIDKTSTFTVSYMVGKQGATGHATFEPDETVEVRGRWPYYLQR